MNSSFSSLSYVMKPAFAAICMCSNALAGCSEDDSTGASDRAESSAGSTVVAGGQDTLEEYYRKLGVPEAVRICQLAALDRLGVTSLQQLEDDQALGEAAASDLDVCVEHRDS
jgi:hypothetical protein